MYPDCTPKEREYRIAREKGAVFLMKVGKTLTNGERHDGRAPDYDDWELNGDILGILLYVLDIALELSSMGIRVDEVTLTVSLQRQDVMTEENFPSRKQSNEESFHTPSAAESASPGSVCSSRKAHIGEVHICLRPKEITDAAEAHDLQLL